MIKSSVVYELRKIFCSGFISYFGIFASFILSLLVVAIFWYGNIKMIPIAVVDNDMSEASADFISMLEASNSLKVIMYQDIYNAEVAVKRGDVNAFIFIPEDFTKNIWSASQSSLVIRYNNQFITQASSLNKSLTEISLIFSAKYSSMRMISAGVSLAKIPGTLLPISAKNQTLFNNSTNYGVFLLGGLVSAIWQIASIGFLIYMFSSEERKIETKAPVIIRLIPYFLLFVFQFLLLQAIVFFLAGIPLNGSISLLFLSFILFVTATMSAGIVFLGIFKKLSLSLSIASIYTTPAFAYAGVTFPYEQFPAFAKIWSNLLPIKHFHKLFVDIAIRGIGIEYIKTDLINLGVFTIVLLPLGIYAYTRRFYAV